MGRIGSVLLAIAALLAFISTANAGILTASRNAMALSLDSILPESFRKITSRTKTPYFSIIITTAFMIVVILFLSIENLVKTASTLKILLFLFVNLSLIIMRESKIQGYRPKFKAPLYPWLQIVGILGCMFLLVKMGRTPLVITAIFVLCSLLWYFIYARKRVNRQAALVHVIERITARELVEATLPDELREIIIDRDEIVEDRFDRLIKRCEIIDFPTDTAMEYNEAFHHIAEKLSVRLKIKEKTIFDLLIEREKETSTIISPGLAIPHIIVKGTAKFDILLVRCKNGIKFPKTKQPVHTMFVLAGSSDERNFHLRTLAAIAQIAQDRNFDRNWLKARNIEELRNIILLAERKRVGTK
jgi:amino acid transporter